MIFFRRPRTVALAFIILATCPNLEAQDRDADLAKVYQQEIRPLILSHCKSCHGHKVQEGDVNLEQFASLAELRKSPRQWQKVHEMLETGQMPPKDTKALRPEESARFQSWVHRYLKFEAKAQAGDPGRVVLRRLSNAEYTYTLRDLTGVDSLQPAREFPIDGAAGEGFTNTGDALSMSPALLVKYLDAAKKVAEHAVFLPDGLRFSPATTRRDWTNDILDQIRKLYGTYTETGNGTKVNLQGIIFDTNQGGRLPIERYLHATLAERDALTSGRKTIDTVAKEQGLSPKYLETLWNQLRSDEPSLLMSDLRARWKQAKAEDAIAITAEILRWQQGLWRFNSVGHIGKLGGPRSWLEPIDPLLAKQDFRVKIPATPGDEVHLFLNASDFGDGNEHDFAVWQNPRFVAAGRPDLLLKDVRAMSQDLLALRADLFSNTAKILQVAEEAKDTLDLPALAKKHSLDATTLQVWLDCLGIRASGPIAVKGHFTTKINSADKYPFVKGWGSPDLPSVLANSSDSHVRIPGNMKPHGVVVHPSPNLSAVVGWQSPIAGKLLVKSRVIHAHPECGNGIAYSLELRRGSTLQRLAAGVAQGAKEPTIEQVEIQVKVGDLLSLVIAPRENHSCDLTSVDLTLTQGDQTWDLAKDVSGDIQAGNPHSDRMGHPSVWHFYSEPASATSGPALVIPKGSLLERWHNAGNTDEREQLAISLQKLLVAGPGKQDSPDATLHRQLASLNGPLLGRLRQTRPAFKDAAIADPNGWGLDPAVFGKHPKDGEKIDANSLCVQAPSMVEIRVPADLVTGYEFVTTGRLATGAQDQGSVQLQVLFTKPGQIPNRQPGNPIVVSEVGFARKRIAQSFEAFRELFPPTLCYTKIVPVDEVVTLTLYYREDDRLAKLMLNDAERRQLDRLWDELDYISQSRLQMVDAFTQLMEFATQDGNPKIFEHMRQPILDQAVAYRQRLVDTQPRHLEATIAFASRAYRRPLVEKEKTDLAAHYQKLRKLEFTHEDAIRLTLARILVSPSFLYRLESPGPDTTATLVSDREIATRLSYFLWSSLPDQELTNLASVGKLRDPDVLVVQMKRMLQDPRTRRLAIEFGCQWLHVRGFDESNEKSETHFPTFASLKGAMYEESILVFQDFFQRDRSVLDLINSDATYVNETLAKHYGIPGVKGDAWQRIEGVRKWGRGGILGLATTLSTQSGASRTSPILRGNWVYEVLLGERLPRPPKGVPQLPDDETKTQGLTVRELVERHSTEPKCAHCHQRIDAFGFALEGFDAIGRRRDKDLANRPIETKVKTLDGIEFEGIEGLRNYLLTRRKDAFVRQFCRKLLGYSLGRATQLSDEPLLDEMMESLKNREYHIHVALEVIVRSPAFRSIRGNKYQDDQP